jgi:hypothetical protein
MARYIDADALYCRVKEKTNPYGKPTLDYESGVKVLNMIEQTPTADVVEVKHGEWIGGEFNNYSGEYEEQCSNCKKFSREYTRPYCPNCGAKMKE